MKQFADEIKRLAPECEVLTDPKLSGCVLVRSPLLACWYYPDVGIAMFTHEGTTLDIRRNVQADPQDLLSLLHIVNDSVFRVHWQQAERFVLVKLFCRISCQDMPKYSDFLTEGNHVFANVGIQRLPEDTNPYHWKEELRARVWKGLCYLYPQLKEVENWAFECGQVMIQDRVPLEWIQHRKLVAA